MVSIKSPRKKIKKEKVKTGKTTKPKKESLQTSPHVTKAIQKVTPEQISTNKIKIKYKMPSKVVTENTVSACLEALEKLLPHHDKKNAIFGDETQIFMEIRSIKILNSKGNVKFVLPHSTVASSGEVCLVTPDLKKGRKHDHEPTVDHWEQMLREAGVTVVKTVLPLRQMKVEYDQYELKRRLLTQFDFIMVDTRVLNHASHLLGKMFFKKHNMLIPVTINEKKDLKGNIDKGMRTVMLRLSEGLTTVVLVGHTGMTQNHLKENILALVKSLKEKFPGGEANIRSLSIKLPLSLSLPLYLTLRPSNTVTLTKIKQIRPKSYVEYEDELTTVLDGTVRVAPDGTVRVIRQQQKADNKNKSQSEEREDENDEVMSNDDNE